MEVKPAMKGTEDCCKPGARRRAPRRLSNGLVNTFLILGSVIFILVLTVLVDRILGWTGSADESSNALIFPPHAKAKYETLEFTYTVETNNIGIRDYDVEPGTRGDIRVVVLGDSYTYGWGVDLQDTWVKRLEARFREQGRNIEFLNLGRPGACPKDYAMLAERALPLLKPDLVIVAALQIDDIDQCVYANVGVDDSEMQDIAQAEWGRWARPVTALASGMRFLYPNISRKVALTLGRSQAKSSQAQEGVDLNELWKRQAAEILNKLDGPAKARFEALDPRLQQAFREVKLHPHLMLGILFGPQSGAPLYLEPKSEEMQKRIARCGAYLARVRQAAAAQGAGCVVVAVPHPFAVSAENLKAHTELGGQRDEQELTSGAADEALAQACDIAGLPFHSVTAEFREQAPNRQLYFKYDGHFTADGHAYFEECVTPVLERLLNER